MRLPSNHTLAIVFLVISCIGLLGALETGSYLVTSTVCILLASNVYAVERAASASE